MICKLFKGSFENFTQAIDSFLVWEGCCPCHTEKKQTLPPSFYIMAILRQVGLWCGGGRSSGWDPRRRRSYADGGLADAVCELPK